MSHIAVLHSQIKRALACLARLDGDEGEIVPPLLDSSSMLALARSRLGLSQVQVDALWLLAAIELDCDVSSVASVSLESGESNVAWLQKVLTSNGLGMLDLQAIRELSALGLVETPRDPRLSLTRRWIRCSDRVLDLATGNLRLDPEIASVAQLVDDARAVTNETLAESIRTDAVVIAVGAVGVGRASVLTSHACETGLSVLQVRSAELAKDSEALERQLRIIARECRILDCIPLFADVDELAAANDGRQRIFEHLILRGLDDRAVLMTAARTPPVRTARTMVIHEVSLPACDQRLEIWRGVLGAASDDVLHHAAATYSITPGAIVAAARAARVSSGARETITTDDIHEGLRAHLDQRLADIATRITTKQRWMDLVLPNDQLEQIAELVARVKHRSLVLEQWGFADKVGRGTGVAALMSGPPGTGKTMVAGLIAKELGLDLYQIDLAKIVSKYIGETEKNLATVFDAAEAGHAVLLFDEADSLFGKRTDVKSSNDRFANQEVNYLLQRMEQFRGICILTTNHETAIDPAFRRRIAIHVRFPTPDEEQREQLWQTMIPEQAAASNDIDFTRLAHDFEMTGGYIKNAVLRAAFLAADEGTSISMAQVWRAARSEYEAMGKVAYQMA